MIRQIEPADHEEWLRMRIALWPDTTLEEHVKEMEGLRGSVKDAIFVAARPEGGLGGFLEASLRPIAVGCDTSPVGYIEGWWVDTDLRQQGIGGQLVRAAEAWAWGLGCLEIASGCLIDNQAVWTLTWPQGMRKSNA